MTLRHPSGSSLSALRRLPLWAHLSAALLFAPDPAASAPPPRLSPDFSPRHGAVVARLVGRLAGPDSAAAFLSADPDQQAAFLDRFWAGASPIVHATFIGHHLGRRRYSVNLGFFERSDLIPARYRTGADPPDPRAENQAVDTLEHLADDLPGDPVARCALGYALLEQGQGRKAETCFIRAVEQKEDYAEARNGLGLAYLIQKKRMAEALRFFHDALASDPGYEAAWYATAMCHLAMGAVDIDHRFRQVVSRFPRHPDAWFKLGVAYEELFEYRLAAGAYSNQILANPGHAFAKDRLARVNLEMSWTNDVRLSLPDLEPLVERDRLRYLPVLAECHLSEGRWTEAADAYGRYLRLLPDDRARLFGDITLIATSVETRTLATLSGEERERFLSRFWLDHDPTPTTPVNERRLEHYRRVHYALQNYGNGKVPWDARGDVYVRLGHPDHRSWSSNLVLETRRDVVRVKNRLNDLVAGARSEILPSDLSTSEDLFASADLREIRGIPVFPVPRRGDLIREGAGLDAAWELWIYGSAGGGIEVTFVDGLGDGVYEFARVPETSPHAALWRQLAPETVVARAVASSPSWYPFDHGGEPLDLHLAGADFQAGGHPVLEVYLGIPGSSLGLDMRGDRLHATVDREVVVYDAASRPVFQDSARFTEPLPDGADWVDQVRAALAPGAYLVTARVRDPGTRRVQTVRQEVRLPPVDAARLSLSGLEVASSIEAASSAAGGRFRKGEVHVVPRPSAAFASGREVGLYYEVYNLLADRTGGTRYRIDYLVRGARTAGVRRLWGAAGRLLGSGGRPGEVAVSYEHEGRSASEPVYVALDIEPLGEGLFDIEVSVTDLKRNDEPTVTRATRVRVDR